MNNIIKYSVIVPVYKIDESRLRECLLSLKTQVIDNVEFIVIDDGSPDNCGKICDELTQDDTRFCVIHSENRGVSHARNMGIDRAKGENLVFVDGDDQLLPGAMELICSVPESDLIMFGYCVNGQNIKHGLNQYRFKSKEKLAIIQASFIGGDNIQNLHYTGAPWGKVYKRSIIIENDCYFDEELPRSQDNEFNFRYMNYVNDCIYVDQIIYNYTVNSNSAMRKFWKKALDNSLVLLDTINSEVPKAIDECQCRQAFYRFSFSKLRDVIDTNIFHHQNDISQKERITQLRNLCSIDVYKECIEQIKIRELSYDAFLLLSFKLHLYHISAAIINARRKLKKLS